MNKRKDVLDKLNIINGYRVKTPAPKRRTAKGLYLNYIYIHKKLQYPTGYWSFVFLKTFYSALELL